MQYNALVIVAILVAGVSAAPMVKREANEEQLVDLLARYLDGNTRTADEQVDQTAVLEEQREEHEEQIVEKEEDGLGEVLLKAGQLQKKKDEQKLQEERELTQDVETELEKKELDLLEKMERELLVLTLKEELMKKGSFGNPMGGKKKRASGGNPILGRK